MNPGSILLAIFILCVVLAAAYWLIKNLMPEPLQKWAIGFLLVLIVIWLLGGLPGVPTPWHGIR